MAYQIAQVDLPGIWQAGAALEANNQRSRLLDMQAQAAQEKLGVEKQRQARLAAFIGTLPQDQQAMFGAFPEEFGAALAKSRFPDPDKPQWAMSNDTLYNTRTGETRPGGGGLTLEGGGTIGGGPSLQNPAQPGGTGGPAELPPLPEPLRPLVQQHAQRTGLDPDFIGRLVMKESTGKATAVSPAGARGLMQAMDETARQPGLGVVPMKDWSEEEQIRFGTDYYAALLKKYGGDHQLALGAWNWGLGNVDKWLANGADLSKVPAETLDFVRTLAPQMAGPPTAPAIAGPSGPAAAQGTAAQAGPNAPLAITPQGQQAAGSAALAAPPPGSIPPNATATAPDGQGLRRVLDKGKPFTTGAPAGHQWAIDQNRQWHAVPIRGGPDAAGKLGNSPEGRALQVLVDAGALTLDQAAAWQAGKQLTGPNGQVDFITPGATLKNLRPGQLSAQDKEAILESDKMVEAGANSVSALRQALSLNEKAFSGPTAELRAAADRWIPGELGGTATTEFQNLISQQALNALKATFGGNPTEGERKILLDLQAGVDKTAKERDIILKNAIAAAERRMDRERQRGEAMRSGTYYTQGLGAPDATPPARELPPPPPGAVVLP